MICSAVFKNLTKLRGKLNRLENQQIYPQKTKYNLSEQLCECLFSYESIWERSEIEIDTDITEDVMIQADAELLPLVWFSPTHSSSLSQAERSRFR